jgi:uncharacterized protein HemY
MKERKWQLALTAFEQAKQQGVDTVQLYSTMASCYLKINKKAQARQMVQEVLRRDPNNTEVIRLQKQL